MRSRVAWFELEGSNPAVLKFLATDDGVHWLESIDLNTVPAEHKAVKQALTDLASRLEQVVPYAFDLTTERVAEAQHEVTKNMDW